MRLTLTKSIGGVIKETVFDIPDLNMMTIIEILESDADKTAGRTPAQGIEARRESNRRADEILAGWATAAAIAAKKGRK